MRYGICPLSIVPVRLFPEDSSEMVTQALYGDHFKILEMRKSWSRIRFGYDSYEGWIDNKQLFEISEEMYTTINLADPKLSADVMDYITTSQQLIFPIPIGSAVSQSALLKHIFEGMTTTHEQDKSKIVDTAFMYLNAPYLWGGKTPFGIDCSGFTQMVYKLNGFKLLRDASQQATQGEPLSFIEESEPGDLAFFDNAEGQITHVGIMMQDHYIIHAHGKVRIDRIDHSGIYNVEKNEHTHKLRVKKSIV